MEQLEARQLLSTVTWISQYTGDWDDSSNWSTNQIPGPSDDVVIPALSGGGAVYVTKKISNNVNSVTADAPIVISSALGLSVVGNNYVPGGPTFEGSFSDSAGVVLNGGALFNADVQAGTKLTTTAAGGSLQDVTIRGNLSFSLGTVSVVGGLTVASGGQVTVGGGGTLSLVESTVDGTGNIVLGSGVSPGLGGTITTNGIPVTLGPGITIHGPNGTITDVNHSLVNEGTIEPDPGGTMTVNSSGNGAWSNASTGLLNTNGGTLNLGGSWSNAGAIEVSNSTLNLGGDFTLAGTQTFTRTGGTVNLTGTLENSGSTLLLDAATGSWNLAGGTLKSGTVVTLDGTELEGVGGGTLDGVTLGATINSQAQPGKFQVAANSTTVANGLTLDQAGVLDVDSPGFLATVVFQGDQSINGTGHILFANRGGQMTLHSNVILGPGVTLHGTNAIITVAQGSLINHGTIDADVAGGSIQFNSVTGTSWTNAAGGLFQAENGGALDCVIPNSVSWTNASGAMIRTQTGGTIVLSGTWSNAGSIVEQNGTLDLGGSFTTAGLGNYTRTGGTIHLTGTLNNTGSTLVLNAATGPWVLLGGTLQGGALATLDGTTLQSGGGNLDGLTLGATIAGQAQTGNILVLSGTTTMTDGLMLANGSVLKVDSPGFLAKVAFQGDQTIGGSGEILFADRGGSMLIRGNMVVGPGITLDGANGSLSIQTGSLLNQGTIESDAGGVMTLDGAAGTSWSSTGLITSKSSTMELGGYFKTSTMGTIDATQGFVGIAGTLTNDIPLALSDATGTYVLDGGTINGGLITTTGSVELLVKGGGTLNGVTLQGTLADDLYGSGVNPIVTNGLTLVGGTVNLAGTNSLTFAGTESLSGTGIINIDSQGAGNIGLLLQGTSTALTIGPGISIHGHGFVGSAAGATVTINGSIAADDGGTLAIQGATNVAGGVLTGGTWEASNNSTLEIIGPQISTNAASVVLSGSHSHIYSDYSATNALAKLASNAAGAQLTVTGGASISDTAALTNAGTLNLGLNSTLTVAAYLQTAGSTSLQWGTLATVPHAGVNLQGGSFSGPGAVLGDLTNAANLDLGNATGKLSVTGNYTQTSTGALTVKLGGTSPGNQYDQVLVSGTANLDGTLGITLANGFGTAIGQSFQVLSFAGQIGNFATINGLSSGGQTILKTVLNPNGLTLQAISNQPDLIVENAAVAAPSAFAGQPITVNFAVENQGGSALTGSWMDSVFLSSLTTLDPSAVLIGHVQHTGGLGIGASYQGSLTAIVPGAAEGNYHVLVEADSQKLVSDVNRSNNVVASPAFGVAIPSVNPAAPVSGTIASGQDVYYRVVVPAGQDVKLTAKFTSPSQADFLVRSLQFPTVSTFDYSYPTPADLTQSMILPGSQPGVAYILLHGRAAAGTGQPFTLSVTVSALEIQSCALQSYSTQGVSTFALTGAGFTPHATVRLVDSSNTAYAAASVTYANSTHLFAAFNLNTIPPGTYQVEAVDAGNVATAPTPLENGADPNVTTVAQGQLSPHEAGGYISVGGSIDVILNVRNQTGHDVIAPVLEITGTNVALPQNPMTIYPFGGDGSGGLLPFVGPYSHVKLDISAPVVPAQAGVGGTIGYGVVDLQAPIDWTSQKDSLRPSNIPADAWDAIYANLTKALGPTPAVMQQVLFNDELYLASLGETVTSIDQLMGFELMKADDATTVPTLSTAVDASIPAPGQPLTFQRSSVQSLDGRYRLGTLGRGWVSNWDISASTDASGKVTVFDAGRVRTFTPRADGTYQAAPGDYGALSLVGGAYQLREKDGTVTAFLPDGRLNYIQDSNGNRVTAGYTAGQLTSLTHSDGDSMSILYNAQGRISEVTDSTGWSTSYTYDASGQHLLSVTNAAGTTQYTYVGGTNIEQEHALQSITHPDGTHTNFSYDPLGRLSQQSGDGGAGQLNYTYFNPGGYTVTDANNAVTQVLYDVNGQPARITDPLGNITQLRYDSNGQLTMTGVLGGSSSSFTYDANGNVTKLVDPLGNTSQFSYNPLFGSLQHYVDPLGNATGYQQDNEGNPLSITYANASTMQSMSDAGGNLTQAVDARGQIIANDYNSRGQILDQTFSDGTHIVYTYDSQGNLATATDANGTTTLTYDNAHHLTRITYPNGQYLKYTYDNAGRRSSMADATGFTEDYQYDAAGRLARLTDGQNNLIASYTYDPAGRLIRTDMGNGTYTTYGYDLAGNMLSLVNYAPGGAINSRFDYTYDAQGLRTSVTTLQGTTTYGYDAAGELTSVVLPGGRTINYGYDAMGNRTVVSDTGATTTSYTTNNLNQYTTVGGITYTYDAAGNLVGTTGPGGGTTYTYDTEDRLIGVQTATDTWTYQYDALGNRIGATHNGQTIHYLVDPLGQNAVVGEFNGNGNLIAHYTQGLGLTSRVDATNTKTFYNFDATGNTVGLSGAAGTYVDSYSYLPFGGILSSTQAVPNPFQFGGQNGVMAQSNGLNIMGARFYDSTTGRFLSRDPIGVAGGGNVYAYARNNPVTMADPSGLDPVGYGYGPGAGLGYYGGQASSYGRQVVYQINADLTSTVVNGARDTVKNVEENPGLWSTLTATATAAWSTFSTWAAGTALGGSTSVFGVSVGAGGVALLTSVASIGAALVSVGLAFDQAAKLYQEWPRVAPRVDTLKDSGGQLSVLQIAAVDPNFLSGPAGYGNQGFIQPQADLPYQIGFENEPDALAPAQTVTITQQIDANLDWSTFQLGSFGFGGQTYSVPAGRQYYTTRIDARDSIGVFVDVTANFDQSTGLLTWQFTSIDPTTLDQPIGDVLEGFLPPDKTAPEGQGWVSYDVQPEATDATGTVITAQADVVFNTNAPIATQSVVNTIDTGAPSSSVAPLPNASLPTFAVNWSGSDDPGGSGIATYDVYVSDNGGAYTPLLLDTTATSTIFTGVNGHTYRFYSVATDNVGNVQPTPTAAQAQTLVLSGVPTTTTLQSSNNSSQYGTAVTFTATVSTSQVGADFPTGTIQFIVDGSSMGTPVTLVDGHATFSTSALSAGGHAITAAYTPADDLFAPSASGTYQESVNAQIITLANVSANNRVYDGTTKATLDIGNPFLIGEIPGDSLTLDTTNLVAVFSDANVGDSKAVSVSGLTLSGASASNYVLVQPTGLTADITAAPLTITATDQTRTYGFGGTSPSLGTTGYTVAGTLYGADSVAGATLSTNDATSSSGNYKAGTYTITPSAASGTGLSNYAITYQADANGLVVNPLGITGSISASNKTYDGTTAAAISGEFLSGAINGDDVSEVGGTATFGDPNVANGKTVTATGLTLSGADSSNYAVSTTATTTANITPAALVITPSNTSRETGTANPQFTVSYTGFVPGEGPSVLNSLPTVTTTATTASPAGTYPITASCAAAGNYTIAYNPGVLSVYNAPTSAVNNTLTVSPSFVISGSVTAAETGPGAPGIASIAVYVAVDNGVFGTTPIATLTPANLNFTYQGAPGHHYDFRSIATDNASNVETKTTVDAGISIATPSPTTLVTSATPNLSNATFTINITGTDLSGPGLASFSVYVAVNSGSGYGSPKLIGTVSAGSPDSSGNYRAGLTYQAVADGVSRSYEFFSVGTDTANNVETMHSTPDLTVTQTFGQAQAPLAFTGLTIQHGALERSFIEYVDLNFNQGGAALKSFYNALVANPSKSLRLLDRTCGDEDDRAVSLSGVKYSLDTLHDLIELDFGSLGLGGVARGSSSLLNYWKALTSADGWYEVNLDLTGSGRFNCSSPHGSFERLLGDTNGDGIVDQNDVKSVAAQLGQSGVALAGDLNGDGVVDSTDMYLVGKSMGRSLGAHGARPGGKHRHSEKGLGDGFGQRFGW